MLGFLTKFRADFEARIQSSLAPERRPDTGRRTPEGYGTSGLIQIGRGAHQHGGH
jgi:hypothetical protein